MTNVKTIRAGLIGCGDISSRHLRTYAECGIELAALCDLDLTRAEKRRAEFGSPDTPIFTDHQELLAMPEIDLVTVATPVSVHAPITIDALQAGKQVACEKPSALSIEENRRIVEAARQTGNKVAFFSSRMRWGSAALARDYTEGGELGRIYHADVQYWRRRGRPGLDCVVGAHWFLDSEQAGAGVLMDMGVYFMDTVMHLLGWPEISAVSAATFRGHAHDLPPEVRFDVEEHCTFLARTDGDLLLSFDLAWIAHHAPKRVVSILGTEGGIRIGGGQPFTFFHERGGPFRWMDTTTEWKDSRGGNQHVYEGLMRAARGEDVYVGTTPEEALALTVLTQMVLHSAEQGQEIRREELPGL
ncbi:MAG: Gfo/Idh/MocA family oxidoreductase [Candidatus Brocadiia bacterium]